MRADGRKIDGMRILVDRELGRNKIDWIPRRLGGGKGEKRRNRDEDDFVRQLQSEFKEQEELESTISKMKASAADKVK